MTDYRKDHREIDLAKALVPEEFPRDAAEIEEHAGTCESCSEELNALKALDAFLREHRDQLSDVLEDCPTPEALVEFASDEKSHPSVAAHLEHCKDCREHIELVRDLSRQGPVIEDRPLTNEERARIRETVSRVWGARVRTESIPRGSIVERIKAFLNVPSLALGVVAAATVVILLMPRAPEVQHAVPVFSDVSWKALPSPFVGKSLFAPEKAPAAKKTVGLVLFVSGTGGPTVGEIDAIYREVDVARRLAASFDFMGPEEVKAAAATRVGPDNVEALTRRLREAIPVDYLLLFRISESKGIYSLSGKLLTRDLPAPRPVASETGLAKERLASRISEISADLLGEAGQP